MKEHKSFKDAKRASNEEKENGRRHVYRQGKTTFTFISGRPGFIVTNEPRYNAPSNDSLYLITDPVD